MNDISLLLSLLSVFFLVMLSLTRVMFVMIPVLVVYEFPGMFKPGFVYERHCRHESCSTSSVPHFDLDPLPIPAPAPASTTLRSSTRLSRPRLEYRVDYEETFASVAKMTTVRTILAIVAS
ncbi:hypothetical protein AAG906_039382 [Vitis piasezkii]